MKARYVLFFSPLLIGAGFPASSYELAARFSGALVSGNLSAARQMMTPDVKIMEWSTGVRPLAELVAYMQKCPLKSFEGNRQHNINVLLDCPNQDQGISITFSGSKIKEVDFGPPPVVHVPVAPPNG